jgi:hypothetical protein
MNRKDDPKGYYAVLGVVVDADAATIKAAYRRRAMELHPDRNRSPNADQQFQLLNEAYATLSDPGARAEYDTMSVTAEESAAATREKPEPIVCSCCGKVSAQPRYAIFFQVKSYIIATTRSTVQGIFCSTCAEKKVLSASALTWLLGWWGIPWGPIYSIHALCNNMLGGKRSALINARLAAHQAWFFASTGHTKLAHAVALDAMRLAKKIPPSAKMARLEATGHEPTDDGMKLRALIQRLLDSLGGSQGRQLKDSWYWARRPFFVQAATTILLAGSTCYWINASSVAYEPPRGLKPYQVGPRSLTASREPVVPVSPPISSPSFWVRPSTAPNGQLWPTAASYLIGLPRSNYGGLSNVTIDNSGNDSDVYAKLVSLDGPTAHPVRFFFIPANGRFTVEKVTSGTYDVRYRDLSSGSLARSEQFSVEETETLEGTRYSNITMTLYKIRNGNMQTYNLAEDDF